jgi:hypothetical protein
MNSLYGITNEAHCICMMATEGGKERTEKEYKELLTVETVFELKIAL